MGAFGDPTECNPVTNRGVELAEATFRGAGMSDRGPHDPGKAGTCARGYFSSGQSIHARVFVGVVR